MREFVSRFRYWIAALLAGTAVVGGGSMMLAGSSLNIAIGTPTPTATATPSSDTFNAAVFPGSNGSTCDSTPTRLSTAVVIGSVPLSATGCTWDQTWDAMNAGDTACVKAADYTGGVNLTGNKASETTFVACAGGVTVSTFETDPCVSSPQGAIFCVQANNATIEGLPDDHIIIDSGTQHGISINLRTGAANTHLYNVDFYGAYASVWGYGEGSTGFEWVGGRFGEDGTTGGGRHCSVGDGQPVTIDSGSNLIANVKWNPQGSDQTPHACSSNGFHLEYVRVESACLTFRNNLILDGGEAGSGYLFWSGSGTSAACQTIEGNYFGTNSDGATAAQNSNTVSSCAFTWRFNFFEQAFSPTAPCSTNGTWEYNAGVSHCGGSHTGNIWSGSGCSGDTTVANMAAFLIDGATFRPQSGSPLRDTGPSSGGLTTDFYGGSRPFNGIWDVGPFEYTG